MSAAILPPAPGLFSTTTDWPQTSCRRLETSRAVISVEPPGVNGTTTRTDLAGQPEPNARDASIDGAARAAAARPAKRRRFSMGNPLDAIARLAQIVVFSGVWRHIPSKSMRRSATLHGVVFDILLIRVLIRFRPARNDVGVRQPAVQVDVAAALGAKRL